MARYEDDYDESKDEACFIATAVYGTPVAEEVDILRQFRDEFLLNNPAGKVFVAVYYKLSPPMAEFISKHRVLRAVVRECFVNPAVALSKSVRSRWAE